MRIIAGEYRGRKVELPPDCGVRPTPDRVREAVFNILYGKVEGSRTLDLFSGSGCVGIEALSRGASHVIFNDKDCANIRMLGDVLQRFHTDTSRYTLLASDWSEALRRVSGRQFDLIYIDPPYRSELYASLFAALPPFVAPEGLVAAEHPTEMPLYGTAGLEKVDSRRYGTVSVSFFKTRLV